MRYSEMTGKSRGASDEARTGKMLKTAGYATGGRASDEVQDKAMVRTAVHKHEKAQHPGEPLTKLKNGGDAEGGRSKPRADRYARGGSVKEPKTRISINVNSPSKDDGANQDDAKKALIGAMLAKAPPPPPPAAMPPPTGPIAGLGAAPGMKRGGTVSMDGGAGGALGRLEKADDQKRMRRGRK